MALVESVPALLISHHRWGELEFARREPIAANREKACKQRRAGKKHGGGHA